MNKMKRILHLLLILAMFIPVINTTAKEEKNLVNIYLFYSDSCSHCKKEKELLKELEKEYSNIRIYKYEIGEQENSNLLGKISSLLDARVGGVPFTVIGGKHFNGFSEENAKKIFVATIEYYSKYGYKDIVGEYIGNVELPSYKIDKDAITVEDYIKEYGNYVFDLPLIGKIQTKDLALPLIAVVMGLIDGFNPCAMWILLFLISMLIGMNDKKRMLIIGFTFLFTSAFIYFLIMIAWLNVASFLNSVIWIRNLIGTFAVLLGGYNFITTIRKKEDGCNVVNDKKRNKIFDKIKKITTEKSLILALVGVIVLAISVNIVELACSAGLPIIFTEILSLNNFSKLLEIIYIIIYVLFFLIDDLIIFSIAMVTLKLTGISTKYGKISKIVGGLILIVMGILLIFFPNIIMLNF